MNKFVEFLLEDVNAKKELITSMPIRLKKDKIDFNDRLDEITNVYFKYKDVILKELLKRYNKKMSQNKEVDNSLEIKKVNDDIKVIEQYMNYNNPVNTYFDKLGFYKYLYILYNYEDYTFNEITDAIDQILTILENAGVKISKNDFYYNYYESKFMYAFLEVRDNKKSFNNLLSAFEEYYWYDSLIIKNIYLNLRSIINKYSKQLDKYLEKVKSQYKEKTGIVSFEECNKELEKRYNELKELKKENIENIIKKAIKKEIDINNYLEDSKARKEIYDNIQIEKIDNLDEIQYKKLFLNLEKLSSDLKEYKMYHQFQPIINIYKEDYENENKIEGGKKNIKKMFHEINSKEKKLKDYKRRLSIKYYGKSAREEIMKQLKTEPLDLDKKMQELYDKYDKQNIRYIFNPFYNDPINVGNVLNLYYSFRFYKLNNERKIINQPIPFKTLMHDNDAFNSFVINPEHDLINVVPVFIDYDIEDVIITKHRFNNLNITKDDLDPDLIDDLINRVELLLRDKKIKESKITAEQISILVQMNNILKKEKIIEETC